ncbi:hypothetical protein PCYB_007740, partial [Plasmodium cynomolgi strain B]
LWSLFNNKYTHDVDDCIFLNQWLYFIIKEYSILDDRIDFYHDGIVSRLTSDEKKYICHYYSYEKNYNEPINIIKLQVFDLNINIIEYMLTNESYLNHLSFKNYICECVNIFKEMYKGNCPYKEDEDKKRKQTCDFLNNFSKIYMSYLYSKKGIKDKIPFLHSTDDEFLAVCPIDKLEIRQAPESELVSESEGISVNVEQSGNTLLFNRNAVVGTIAGMPPFLALIYKVNISCA